MKKQQRCARTLSIWALVAMLVCAMQASALAEAAPPPHTPLPEGEESVTEMEGQDNGTIRVLLTRLGKTKEMTLTLDGSYSVGGNPGFRFTRGAQVHVSVVDKNLYISHGDLTLNMGKSFTFTRHKAKGTNAAVIHSIGGNLFAGDLQLKVKDGRIQLILHIGLQEYLYGVLPYEMANSWPMEALKAQAVAARTYALGKRALRKNQEYDVVDTPNDQVYKGFNPEHTRAVEAVNATRGLCGVYKGRYADCFYTASNGGQTDLPQNIWGGEGDYGYVQVQDDPYDLENPQSIVNSLRVPALPTEGDPIPKKLLRMLSMPLTEQLAAMGYSDGAEDIRIDQIVSITPHTPKHEAPSRAFTQLTFEVKVSARKWVEEEVPASTPDAPQEGENAPEGTQTPAPAPTPRLVLAEMLPVEQTFAVEISVFSQLKGELGLGINGRDYELVHVVPVYLTPEDGAEGDAVLEGFDISLRRFGHGVGMSQRGAQWMAAQHEKTFMEILSFYYPGMQVIEQPLAEEPLPPLKDLPARVYNDIPAPTPKPTPAPLPQLPEGARYAFVNVGAGSLLNVRRQPTLEGEVQGTLADGQQVIVLSYGEDGWALVRTAELEGYASMEYLALE